MMVMTSGSLERCTSCGCEDVRIIDSRPTPEGRRRRRVCGTCQQRWSTIEVDANSVDVTRNTYLEALYSG